MPNTAAGRCPRRARAGNILGALALGLCLLDLLLVLFFGGIVEARTYAGLSAQASKYWFNWVWVIAWPLTIAAGDEVLQLVRTPPSRAARAIAGKRLGGARHAGAAERAGKGAVSHSRPNVSARAPAQLATGAAGGTSSCSRSRRARAGSTPLGNAPTSWLWSSL